MTGRITYRYILTAALFVLALVSCIKQPHEFAGDPDNELTSIDAGVATRAGEVVSPSVDYVGRSKFADEDRIVFKTIKRKENPIASFTYTDIEFVASVKEENGKESIGWSRDKTKGRTESGVDKPDRIYWSDATNPHVFVGYCAPQGILDWHLQDGVYYGTLGAPGETGTLDFKTGGNELLCKNDVLLTYSQEIKADDAIARLQFHHSLAQVRVIVNISEFAAGGGDDKHSVVSDMILNNMPTQYRWSQTSVTTQMAAGSALRNVNLWIPNPEGVGADANKTFTFYGLAVPRSVSVEDPLTFSFTVTYPDAMNPSTTKSHTYNASISGLSFTSGQCTTINISLNHQNEKITVGAEYDDWEFVESLDQGSLKKESIFLTTLARKTGTDIKAAGVTILGDPLATLDDATWLYIDKTTPDHPVIRDIYGNPGTLQQPFVIKSAEQLLSLAYEVSGTGRINPTSVVYYTNFRHDDDPDAVDVDPVRHTLPASGNFDFQSYYVSLEANLFLQPSMETPSASQIDWPGIGVYLGHENAGNKPFNGRLMAGVRIIKLLKGRPLFNYIGPQGHIDQLILEDVVSVSGNAAFVEVNEGVICASKVGSKLTKNPVFNITGSMQYDGGTDAAPKRIYVGAFCAKNDGALLACYSTARIRATKANRVGGIVGLNNGLVLCSYAAGTIDAPVAETNGIYGIAAGNGKVFFHHNEVAEEHDGTLTFCLYDRNENDKTTTEEDPDELDPNLKFKGRMGSYAVTSSYLQSHAVVGTRGSNDPSNLKTLNGELENWVQNPESWPPYLLWVYNNLGLHDTQIIQAHVRERYYEYHVAAYPRVY